MEYLRKHFIAERGQQLKQNIVNFLHVGGEDGGKTTLSFLPPPNTTWRDHQPAFTRI